MRDVFHFEDHRKAEQTLSSEFFNGNERQDTQGSNEEEGSEQRSPRAKDLRGPQNQQTHGIPRVNQEEGEVIQTSPPPFKSPRGSQTGIDESQKSKFESRKRNLKF